MTLDGVLIMNNKTDWEIGDNIYVCGYGWCLVTKLLVDVTFPLVVKSINGITTALTLDGKVLTTQENPVAFTYDPIDGTEPPKHIEYVDYLGTSIPKYLTQYPSKGCEYYFREANGELCTLDWKNSAIDIVLFNYGIWADKEEAEIAIEAINKVMKVN